MSRRHPISPLLFVLCVASCGPNNAPDQDQGTPPPPIEDMPIASEMDLPTPDMAPDMPSPRDMLPDYDGPIVLDAPRARVWRSDPERDEKTSEVTLVPPSDPDGLLSLPELSIYLCANEDGEPLFLGGQQIGSFCKPMQRARPRRGEYLHHALPVANNSADDSFSEVQAYFHLTRISERFTGEYELATTPASLPVWTNAQFRLDATGAAQTGRSQGWNTIDNAYYLDPRGLTSYGAAPSQTGLLLFGQGPVVDYTYDASILYHEYIHAIIGPEKMRGVFLDSYGMNNTPGAVNEALADYFAASIQDDPIIGAWALDKLDKLAVRDLSTPKRCPDALMGEIHADSRVLSTMLWHLREELGEEVMAKIILGAIGASTPRTGLAMFAELLEIEASREGASASAAMNQALTDWGIRGCVRARPLDFFAVGLTEAYTIQVPGLENSGDPSLKEWSPSFIQIILQADPGQAIQLSWKLDPRTNGQLPATLQVAAKKSGPLILTDATNGSHPTFDHDHIHTPPLMNFTDQIITFAPDCMNPDGSLHLIWLNTAPHDANITRIDTLPLDTPESGFNLVTCPD